MHTAGDIARFIIHKLLLLLLALTLSFGIFLMVLATHVTNPETPQRWLVEGGVYENVVPTFFDLVQFEGDQESVTLETQEGPTLGEQLDANDLLDKDALVRVVDRAIPPEFLSNQGEGVISGLYAWLQGDVDSPEFSFDLSTQEGEVTQFLGEEVRVALQELPECTPEQLVSIGLEFDVLESACSPPGVDLNAEIDAFVAEFTGQEGFLGELMFTDEDLDFSGDDLATGQTVYAWANASKWLVPVLIIALTALAIVSARHWLRGVRDVGTTLLTAGFFLLLGFLIFSRLDSALSTAISEDPGASQTTIEAAQTLLEPFANVVIGDISSTGLTYSAVILVLGVLVIVGWFIYRRQNEPEDEKQKKRFLEGDGEITDEGEEKYVKNLEEPEAGKNKTDSNKSTQKRPTQKTEPKSKASKPSVGKMKPKD